MENCCREKKLQNKMLYLPTVFIVLCKQSRIFFNFSIVHLIHRVV